MDDNARAPAPGADKVALKFSGRPGEYFRIWIVNLCLSIITLGIYSAWAKVRRRRYFYGNTRLNDASFDYTANPKSILLGRLLVVGVFVAYSISERLLPITVLFFIPVFLLLTPWVMVRAMRFNLHNSTHRNVRFGFHGTYGGICWSIGLSWLAAALTLGLTLPFFLQAKDRYLIEHSAYGTTRFVFRAGVGKYYVATLKVILAGMGFLVGSIISLGILALPLYILVRSYAIALMGRLRWDNTELGTMRFSCGWTTWKLFGLYSVNALGVLFSLGLLVPWAAIRTARYQLEGLSLHPVSAVSGFIASSEPQVAAVGEEAGELLGFDFGL